MIKVFGVYGFDGALVDLDDWTDAEFAAELARAGLTVREYMVPPFVWRPRIPRCI